MHSSVQFRASNNIVTHVCGALSDYELICNFNCLETERKYGFLNLLCPQKDQRLVDIKLKASRQSTEVD